MLQETWDIFASHRSDIAALSEGPRYTRAFSDWIKTGESSTLREAKSGIVAMQSLVIIQVVQYFQYLELTGISHAECIKALRKTGGIQGYCAGLLPALAIGCARFESEVVQNAKAALRVALAIGAYQQLGDDESIPGATTIILRLSTPGEGDEIVGQFPGVSTLSQTDPIMSIVLARLILKYDICTKCYVSAVTDPRTISVVGPVQALKELSEFARGRGLLTQDMHLRGKIHNPENLDLARELCEICDNTPSLQLPSFDKLQLPLRSNRTGGLIQTCSLTHEAVYTILAARCEWYTLLERVAQDLKSTGENSHGVVCFGLGDCVPVSAFRLAGLSLTKTNVAQAIKQVELQKYEFNRNAIAVVGASCRLPGANSTDELWKLVSEAVSMCEPVRPERMPPHWKSRIPENDVSGPRREYYGNFVDDIDKFDHEFFRIGAKEASYMDPQQRVLLELAYEALDSGGHLGGISRGLKNVGCFIGSGTQEYLENTSSHPPTAFTATGTIRAFLCGRLSHHFGWSGPAEVIDTACSSSLVAVHRACRAILGGECVMAVAGGVSFITGNVNHLDLGKAGFLSPTGQCKPFDASADGYCRADGAGLVVLKKLEDAKASGDHVLGVITATATNQGGGSTSITVPHAPAQTELLQTVLSLSGMTADHVTYVEAHGTGTSVGACSYFPTWMLFFWGPGGSVLHLLTSFMTGDPIEMASLRKVFGGPSRLAPLQIGTIKGNVGHCESAAGIAGLLKALAMLKAGKIPPLANFKELNPNIPPLGPDKMIIAQSTEPWSAPIRVACVNSYGAAGSNAALLCCEYPSENDRDLLEGDGRTSQPLPICISAHSRDSLMRYMDLLGRALGSQHVNLSDLAFSLNERREHHRFRLSTVAVDTASLHQELMRPKQVSEVPPKTPVVMAFGGQTKQFVGLERFFYDTCPRLRQYIDTCDEILVRLGFPSIIPAIFDTAPIADVRILQTATFAMQYACARCWIDSGLEVEAVIGHSFGELTALGVSGTWELTDCIRAIATRAGLMVTEWGAERGSMLAVHTDRDTALGLTRRAQDCEIACYNAEMSQVVVGPTESIAKLERILVSEAQYAQIRSQRLDVTHGFHSKLTEPLLSGLRPVAATIPVVTPKIRIETCTSARCDKVAPDHIVRHIRDPVYFEDAVRRIEDRLGPCYWVEAGFNSSIIPMLKRAVRSPTLHKFQALNFRGSELREHILPKVISDLWLDGMDVSFWPFLTVEESRPRHMTLPPYCFTRRGAWVENFGQMRVITEGISHQVEQPPKPVQLVSGPEVVGKQKVCVINTESKRFRDIVHGHAVLNSPLCPASMYMEFATMSAQLAGIDMSKGTLCFDDFHLEGPLGVDQGRRVTVTLQPAKSPAVGWEFSVQSARGTGEGSSVTIHARGLLAIRLSRPHLEPYGRMISDQVNQLQSNANHEKLMATRAYRLFSQVVTYAEFLRGIKSVMISEGRALAEVQLPSGQVGTEESTAVGMCDAVSLDMFMQVSGLLINTGDHSESGSVFVATDIASATLSDDSSCFLQNTTWKVYATFVPAGEIHVTADVFVLWPDGSLALTVLGVRFTKLPISRLERLLQGNSAEMGTRKKPNTAQKTDQMALGSQKPIVAELRPIPTSATDRGIVLSPVTASETEQKLKDVISSLTGAAIDRIDEDILIVNLGVDSLAAVELVDDLANHFDIEVSATQLLTCSFKDLLNLLGRSKKGTLSPSGPRIVTSGSPSPAPHPGPFASPARPHKDTKRRKFDQIIAGACGADFPELQGDDVTLCDLGVDSLAAIQLKSDLESAFDVVIGDDDILLDSSLGRITRALGLMGGCDAVDANLLEHSAVVSVVNDLPSLSSSSSGVLVDSRAGEEGPQINHARNAFEALLPSERELSSKGKRCGVATSWKEVTRRQNAITVAYITEAFKQLGADLAELKSGTEIPSIPHLPRYSRALERYRIILQKHGYIESDGNTYRRTSLQCLRESACDLVISFGHDYPAYASEAELVSIAGPRLADCLAGRESAISLLFGGKRSRTALEDYYAHSPMLAASTELLVEVASRIVAKSKGAVIRIIEVGAGCK